MRGGGGNKSPLPCKVPSIRNTEMGVVGQSRAPGRGFAGCNCGRNHILFILPLSSADDFQIYRHFSLNEASDAVAALNADLRAIQDWARSFGLLVNPSKSQALIVGSGRLRSRLDWLSLPGLVYDGTPIAYADKVKNLGLIMDAQMTWVPHINGISKRMHFSFHSLRRLQNFLPISTKILLAQSLLLPLLDYADVCFLDVTEESLNRLERLQNLAIRFIFGLRKYDHVSDFRVQLKWLPIRLRRDMHILSFLYSILKNPKSPPFLRSRFQYLPPDPRSRRSCITKALVCPHSNTNFLFNSFTVRAVRLWNKLPKAIQECPSIEAFKRAVKQHYL